MGGGRHNRLLMLTLSSRSRQIRFLLLVKTLKANKLTVILSLKGSMGTLPFNAPNANTAAVRTRYSESCNASTKRSTGARSFIFPKAQVHGSTYEAILVIQSLQECFQTERGDFDLFSRKLQHIFCVIVYNQARSFKVR